MEPSRAVAELHAFFEAWFTGRLPDDEAAFAPVVEALAPDFELVGPDGRTTPRAPLLAALRAAHGARPDLAIRVERVRARDLGEAWSLVRYEEWHDEDGASRGRASVALLRGAAWHLVQETRLPQNSK